MPTLRPGNFSRGKLTAALLAIVVCPLLLDGVEPDLAQTMEKAAGDWIAVRKETARLETEWSEQRPLLESMSNRLAEQAQETAAKRDAVLAKTATDRQELARLQEAVRASTAEMSAGETQLKALSAALVQLRPALPPALSQALELPYRSLGASDLSANDRLQFAMTVLNRCLQFNRTITCQKEALQLDAGNPKLCEVIYWGLSHGYALNRSTQQAWYGTPTAGNWRWEPLPGGADPVARLIASYYAKGDPGFVDIAARVKSSPVESAKNQAP